jgi:alcohol dehydrogenase class IV
VHSCAHALSTVADLHHGYANGLMIDHALAFNVENSAPKFRVMARTIGLPDESPPAFLRWLTDLKMRIGIPSNLAAAKVPKDALQRLPRLAFEDSCHQNNPRPLREEDFRAIYERAYAG